MRRKLSTIETASLILALTLILCLYPMPYGFYTIVRLAAAVIGVCWSVKFYNELSISKAIVAGAIAVLFQPLIKITLDRLTWNIVDIVVAVMIAIVVFSNQKKSQNDERVQS